MGYCSVEHLPDYHMPPVNEVVLSVQFAPISRLEIAHFGDFWKLIKSEFPNTEHKNKLPRQIEHYGNIRDSQSQLQIVNGTEIPRIWFQNSKQNWLIQIQNDRFIMNWIKENDNSAYPRYDEVFKKFNKYLDIFINYITDYDIGDFVFDQCEVIYINTIKSGEGWVHHSEADKIVKVLSLQTESGALPEPEDASLTLRYPLIHDSNQIGRLYVELGPRVRRSDNLPGYELRLTARGQPIGDGEAGIRKFFDLGHENIVRMFDAITTSKMHEIWERKDG